MSYHTYRLTQVLLQWLKLLSVRQIRKKLPIGQRSCFTFMGWMAVLYCCFALTTLCQAAPTSFSVLEPLNPSNAKSLGNIGVSYGINNNGNIVGYCDPNGFTSDGHKMTLLGTLGGRRSAAHAVNDVGEVTGRVSLPGGKHHAFLFNKAEMVDLDTLDYGFGTSTGFAINNYGQVAGESTAFGEVHAFLWTPDTPHGTTGTMVDLSLPDSVTQSVADSDHTDNDIPLDSDTPSEAKAPFYFSHAFGINDKGQVTGEFTVAGIHHAFLWTPSTNNGTDGKMIDLGSLSSKGESSGQSINSNGDVVGSSDTRAFLFSKGVMKDLGVPDNFSQSRAVGINAKGQILIIGSFNKNREYHHYQYGENLKDEGYFLLDHNKMLDLNMMLAPGRKPLGGIWGINDKCQIAASVYYGSAEHAVLLTPVLMPLVHPTPKKPSAKSGHQK